MNLRRENLIIAKQRTRPHLRRGAQETPGLGPTTAETSHTPAAPSGCLSDTSGGSVWGSTVKGSSPMPWRTRVWIVTHSEALARAIRSARACEAPEMGFLFAFDRRLEPPVIVGRIQFVQQSNQGRDSRLTSPLHDDHHTASKNIANHGIQWCRSSGVFSRDDSVGSAQIRSMRRPGVPRPASVAAA